MNTFRTRFSADANNYILQARTWEQHDVGGTAGFNGDTERALHSIKVDVLYMPSETDLYFPVGDARYAAQFIPRVRLLPIPSVWGHPAGAGANPADRAFLNQSIGRFLAGERSRAKRPTLVHVLVLASSHRIGVVLLGAPAYLMCRRRLAGEGTLRA